MSDSLLLEPNSVPADSYRYQNIPQKKVTYHINIITHFSSHNFFAETIFDKRYQKVTYIPFYPINSLKDADVIQFSLGAWSSSSVYILSKALLYAKVKICKKDGTALDPDTTLSPINLVATSIFEGSTQ